jgi:uncharacterized protein
MKKAILIILLFHSILAFSQDTSNVAGFTVFKYENGNISSKGVIKNGKPDGYWKTYYENGVLKSEGDRKNFELDSIWKFYNEDGKLILEITYKNGKKNGIKTTYLQTEIVKENYINDVKEGFASYYYADTTLRLTVKFVKGKEQGFAREFSKKGDIITLLEYKNGYLINKEFVNRFISDSLKSGKWISFYTNGNERSEGYYKSGIKNGYFKEYSEDGNLKTVSKYIDGVLQKEAAEIAKLDVKTEYYSNGQIKKRGSYKNNISEGISREYSPEGKIIASKIYLDGIVIGDGIVDENGVKQGPWKEYHDGGELRSVGKYVNGLKIGEWKFYYKNGKLEQTGVYLKNEKPDGEWKWYYDNGNLWMEEFYDGGLENGMMTEYSDSGTVIAKGNYVDGLEDSSWVYQMGDTKVQGSYKEGKREGTWKYYYDNGNLNFSGKYIDDNADGKHSYYWDNGKLREEGFYIMGRREGEWYKFNYDGTLFLTTTYKNGIEIKYDGVKIKPATIEDNSGD